jgi:hypothetical protein
MDIVQQRELSALCDKQIDFAQKYADARRLASESQTSLDILLVASLKTIRQEKPNVGYEMAIRILMETNIVAQQLFVEMEKQTALYKGFEKLIEAHQNKISALQSLMRYVQKGEKYGI